MHLNMRNLEKMYNNASSVSSELQTDSALLSIKAKASSCRAMSCKQGFGHHLLCFAGGKWMSGRKGLSISTWSAACLQRSWPCSTLTTGICVTCKPRLMCAPSPPSAVQLQCIYAQQAWLASGCDAFCSSLNTALSKTTNQIANNYFHTVDSL